MGESVLYFGNVVDQRHRGDVYSARVGSTTRILSSLIKKDEHHETPNCAPPNWPANCVARIGLRAGPRLAARPGGGAGLGGGPRPRGPLPSSGPAHRGPVRDGAGGFQRFVRPAAG